MVLNKKAINQLGLDEIVGDCAKFDKTDKNIYIAYQSQDGKVAKQPQLHLEKRDLNFNLLYKYELAGDTETEAPLGMFVKNNSIYLVGYTTSSLLLIKINDNGTAFTQEILKKITNVGIGGSRWFGAASDIQVDDDDNIYMSGYIEGQMTPALPDGSRDVFLFKFDKNGNEIWRKQTSGGYGDFDSNYRNNLVIKNNRIFNSMYSRNGAKWISSLIEWTKDGDIDTRYIYDVAMSHVGYDICVDDDFNIYTVYSNDDATGVAKLKLNKTSKKLEKVWNSDFDFDSGSIYHINIQNNQLIVSDQYCFKIFELDGTKTKEIKLDEVVGNEIKTAIVESSLYSSKLKAYFIFGRSTNSIAATNPDGNQDSFMIRISEILGKKITMMESQTLNVKID